MTKNEIYDKKLLIKESDLYRVGDYINSSTKIEHTCINEHKIYITPNSVLSGTGCSECKGYKKRTNETYVKELLDIGVDVALLENYKDNKTPIKHKCSHCGNEWKVTPRKLLKMGSSCPACNNTLPKGFNKVNWGYLYYVKILHENSWVYKLGITNKPIHIRFQEETKHIETIRTIGFVSGEDAYLVEQSLLKAYEDYKVPSTFPKILKNTGNTEIFIKDILNLDK